MQLDLHWHTFLLRAILVAFPITADDADASITFNEGPLHILEGLAPAGEFGSSTLPP
jgi:hypothetical protein